MHRVETPANIEQTAISEKPSFILFRISGVKLLIAAAIFHIAIACSIYAVGRSALLPSLFDRTGTLAASDNQWYLLYIQSWKNKFVEEGFSAWMEDTRGIHVKFYALSYLVFERLFGLNILSLEPLNLLFYLTILTLIFRLGREVFDRRVGLVAAAFVAFLPSFLLHTTQIFRDPIFIAGALALILVTHSWMKDRYSLRQAIQVVLLGILSLIILLLTRWNMWELAIGIILIGAFFLLLRQLLERRLLLTNTLAVAAILIFAFSMPHDFKRGYIKNYWYANLMQDNQLSVEPYPVAPPPNEMVQEQTDAATQAVIDEKTREAQAELDQLEAQAKAQVDNASFWTILPWRLWILRTSIANAYGYNSSNIDADVQFTNLWEVIRYTPRALQIGLFAPFPNRWFTSGSMGRGARLLSGLETLLMYLLQGLAAFTVWHWRKNLTVWFLASVVCVGVTLQAIVIANLGALFRMRYVFWMLIIVLGVQGGLMLLAARKAKLKENAETA